MKNTLVSCILTTFNRKELLIRSLSSILNQTYKNLEIIIVDDGSNDGTKDLVKKKILNLDPRLKYLRHKKNKGLAAARNSGLINSKGEFIAFLDDDDEWIDNKIDLQIKKFKVSSFKNLGMVTCGIRRIKKDNVIELIEKLRGNLFEKLIEKQALIGNGSCVMIKKKTFLKCGGFDTRYKIGIDGYFFSKVSKYFEIDFCSEILVNYNEDDLSRITTNTSRLKMIDAYRLRIKNNQVDFNKYPKQLSNVYFRIGLQYIMLNKYKDAIKNMYISVKKKIQINKILFLISYLIFPIFIKYLIKSKYNS